MLAPSSLPGRYLMAYGRPCPGLWDQPLVGQQTNSTPEKREMPQGRSMAKLRRVRSRSWQLCAAVWFHRSNSQQRVWLWMWSNRQFSGTSSASLWNGPSANTSQYVNQMLTKWDSFSVNLKLWGWHRLFCQRSNHVLHLNCAIKNPVIL